MEQLSGAEPTSNTDDHDQPSQKYDFLTQRAIEFVRSNGGAVEQDKLITHVFGSGSATLWQSLLRTILEADGSLVLRVDGWWAVPGAIAPPSSEQADLLGEFVAVDVETTGLRPLQQRIIEVAVIRYAGGGRG